jgi:biopolymer transport protein ExbD
MAEMNTPERSSQGPRRAQKLSTRVDLTAMVDLGFLLITFFMLASAFQKPKAMEVNKPVPPEDPEQLICSLLSKSKTFTLVAGKNDKIYCYTGADYETDLKVDSLSFSRQDLRKRIIQRQQEVKAQWGHQDELFVSLKFFPKSKYRNMVDLLDEMKICGVKRYAIVDEWNEMDGVIAARSGNL